MKKHIRPEIKWYIDQGYTVPWYVPLTPDEDEYIKKHQSDAPLDIHELKGR